VARAELWLWNLTKPQAWVVRLYRISHALHRHGWRFIPALICAVGRVLSSAEIDPAARVGYPFNLSHGMGVVIGGGVVIGDGCIVSQCVTIGSRRDMRMPRLGDRVGVGANAVLLGPITIGDDARIGAGAVVLCDVPAGWTAVGNPARLLPPKEERITPSS
jgi:serine O-acetyltransferase